MAGSRARGAVTAGRPAWEGGPSALVWSGLRAYGESMDTALISLARALVELPSGVGTLTLSIDIDGARRPRRDDCLSAFDSLAHRAKDVAGSLGEEIDVAVAHDLRRLRAWLEGLDRDGMRGAVMVARGAGDVFETIVIPHPIADHAAVGDRARVMELTQVADAAVERMVLLVDRRRARLFSVVLGRLTPVAEVVDAAVRRHDQGGWSAANLQRHADELGRRHLEHTAAVVARELRARSDPELLIGGPSDDLAAFEEQLEPSVRGLIAGHLGIRVDADDGEVRDVAAESAILLDEARAAQALVDLHSAAGEQRGVEGLEATLDAVSAGRAARLVVALPAIEDAATPGWRCLACGSLSASERRCRCGASRATEADILDAAVAAALRTGCWITWVRAPWTTDDLGGIGALLRY
jgi:peptide subunit release factor 1 (eRF1)